MSERLQDIIQTYPDTGTPPLISGEGGASRGTPVCRCQHEQDFRKTIRLLSPPWWTCVFLILLLPGLGRCVPQRPHGPLTEDDVCSSMDIRNSLAQFDKLTNCTVIEGFLQILLIEHVKPEEYDKLRFPKLVQVTDYILVYRVYGLRSFKTIFPNLAVIRGVHLFFDYALVAFEVPELEELGFSSLVHISRGAVRLEKNSNLCYINTIDWDRITKAATREDYYISSNKKQDECVDHCPKQGGKDKCALGATMTPLCWSYDTCQQVCKCENRACYVNKTDECCHPECVGGCFGPAITDCVACKGFYSQGRCLSRCEPQTFEFQGWRCILSEECSNKSIPNPESPYNGDSVVTRYRAIDRKCTENCPEGFMEDTNKPAGCIACDGKCPKVCQGDAVISSVAEAQSYKGCTVISGALIIHLQGGEHVFKSLDEYLGDIEEVHRFIQITRSSMLSSLKFLKNLRKIYGEGLYQQRYALLVLGNHYLQEIWDHTHPNLTLVQGRFYFHQNPHLCVHRIEEMRDRTTFLNKTYTEDYISPDNGEKMLCKHDKIPLEIKHVHKKYAIVKFPMVHLADERHLLGYVMHYKEAATKNLTILSSKFACDNEGWMSIDAHSDYNSNSSNHLNLLPNLKPWTQYGIYVDTYMLLQSAKGGTSDIHYFRTKPDQPTNPRDITVAAVAPNELVVKWKAPRQPNGNVTHYYVYWQKKKLRRKAFDIRDYCNMPQVHIDKTSDKDQVESNKTRDPNCCACPKTPKEVRKEEAERLFEIKFENYLHNTVYRKRPLNDNFLNGGDGGGTRKKRSLGTANSSAPINSDFDLPGLNMTLLNMTKIQKNETELDERDQTPYHASVVYYRTEILLSQLHHFQEYSIEVLACHGQNGDTENSLCSNRAITTGRTLPSDLADTIDPNNVTATKTEDDRILIKWAEPTTPNGIIVTYTVRAERVNKVADEEKVHILCVPHKKYSEVGGYLLPIEICKNPGNYSYRLQATSLVGNGSWTKDFYFQVEHLSTDSMLPNEIVIGIVTSAAAILLAVVGLGVWFVAKRKFAQNNPNGILYVSVNPEYTSVGKLDAYIPDEWEVPREKISLLRELGQGSFGMVYEGMARNLPTETEKEVLIAVKTVNEGASLRDRIEFLNEASVMKAFKCNHVVRLKGVVSQGQPTLVLMELMSNGDLKNYLRMHRPDEEDNAGREPLTLKQILEIAGEIADGMAYLSDKKYVHRDLAARNCMVDANLVVKIGDFGMTRDIYERDYYRKGGKGLLPVRWMSPESLKDGVFSSQSDVWSYGVVLWEMATLAAQPYQGLSNEQVLKFVIDGDIMEKPERCPAILFTLMMKCWQHNPKHRPTFHEMIEMLVPDLNPSFKEVSYFFSIENQGNLIEGSTDNIDLDEADVDEPNVRTPLNGSPSRDVSRLRDSVHSSDIEAPLAKEDSISVDIIPPTRDLYKLPRSISNHSSAEAPIVSSNDGSKGSTKSNTSSYGMNGLANGHVPRQAPKIC